MTALTTLTTLKAELGVTGSASDDRLTRLITQVSASIETFLDRRLERRSVTDTFATASRALYLSAYPVIGTPVVTDSGTVLTSDQYLLDDDNGIIVPAWYGVGYGSPCGYRWWGITTSVVYTGGYILPDDDDSDLPGDIERACIDLAARYFHGGGRDPALRSETVPGVIEQSWSAVDSIQTLGGLPLDVAGSLSRYQRAVL